MIFLQAASHAGFGTGIVHAPVVLSHTILVHLSCGGHVSKLYRVHCPVPESHAPPFAAIIHACPIEERFWLQTTGLVTQLPTPAETEHDCGLQRSVVVHKGDSTQHVGEVALKVALLQGFEGGGHTYWLFVEFTH